MAGELGAVHRVAGSGEAVGDEPHLGWRAAQTMHQQHAGPAACHVVALVLDSHLTPPCGFEFVCSDPMRRVARPLFQAEQIARNEASRWNQEAAAFVPPPESFVLGSFAIRE